MHALRRRLVFLVVLTIAVLAFAQVAHAMGDEGNGDGNRGNQNAQANQDQGNHGSVKVDDDEIDDGPANHPHVICGLHVVVEHVDAPFDIDFLAQPPTTREGDDQRLLIVHVPDEDSISGIVDLSGFVGGIDPDPHQGFHIFITVHLPDGDKHKVIWLGPCPKAGATTTTTAKSGGKTTGGGTTTTTAATGGTTTTAQSGTTTTSTTTVAGALTNTTVPTQVLGENFVKPAAASAAAPTSLANTGNPFSPALAVGFVLGGLGLVGAARHVSGRRFEAGMRRSVDRER